MTISCEKHKLRPASEVMTQERIGAFRLTSLSFLRTMLRNMMRENWQIECTTFDLNEEGYGYAIYSVQTPKHLFSFIVISTRINEEERSDRVISEKWDVTFALCEGTISSEKLERLKVELPKQEVGRSDSSDLVWSRANKSNRVFNYVIECLTKQEQPDPQTLNEVGYLLRTTAVYGNGKFGLAPYEKIKNDHPFSGPFQAQMFAVYMLRHFSFHLVEHIAHEKNSHSIKLGPEIKRFMGTGNATGLGMAPFLISHPKLIHQWIFFREKAIARVKDIQPSQSDLVILTQWLERVSNYFEESRLIDREIFVNPEDLDKNIKRLKSLVVEYMSTREIEGQPVFDVWQELTEMVPIETQELLYTLLLELYAEHVIELEQYMGSEESYQIDPKMTVDQLKQLINDQYAWVFDYDFTDPEEKYYFWYRSEEKEEPRLGIRGEDPGEEFEMPLNIAEQVQEVHQALENDSSEQMITSFILKYPKYKGIIKRIQSLNGYEYGEIRMNLLSKKLSPVNLLRCKLSFFGAERFNPKSDRWVRITLFQGAPLVEEIGEPFADNWVFPQIPTKEGACYDSTRNNYY
ncbi:hypothetical protein [uncultured Marinococcus sp.]|uniref:hypothetical protein n=1 Tax=uncultured Marinococcus sp. TaxID=487012 RepID=UPI00260F97F1|nr:hypothetical protein [uncultured Marinococcus sp.]